MAKLREFFDGSYLDWASYDNFRKIPNIVDGFFNVKRKILFVGLDKSSKKRTDLFSNETIADSKYIHGSLDGSVIGMTCDYVGSNNINYFKGYGDFGARLDSTASATRYTSVELNNIINLIFRKEDEGVLIKQKFEGFDIEYKFYVPIVPMLFVNGSEAPSVGFRHVILPRNIIDIVNNIKNYISNKPLNVMIPHYNGFNGTIEAGKGNRQWIFKGNANIVNTTTVEITELPLRSNICKDMISYRKYLSKLKADKKIKSFTVKNDTKKDFYLYEIKMERKILSDLENSNDKLLDYFGLISTDSEILYMNNINNKVIDYSDDINKAFADYCDIRLEYYEKRKLFLIDKLVDDITLLMNRIRFIECILNDEIVFKKQTKIQIENQLSILKFDFIDFSYNYLLNMNIYSLTKDKLDELKEKESNLQKKLNEYEKTDIRDIWLSEIDELVKSLGYSTKDFKQTKPQKQKLILVSTPTSNNALYTNYENNDRRTQALELMKNLESSKLDKRKLF